jgi:hypothetical protein
MIRTILFLLMLSVSFTFYSCDTRSALAVEDFDVVVTFYDNLAPFSTIRRYSMPDSIVVIVDSSSSVAGNVTHAYDSLILNVLEKELAKIGYSREFTPSQNPPDVIVIVSAVVSDRYNATGTYDLYEYWNWYTGWTIFSGWGPGWFVSFPWQPSDIAYNYPMGTLVIMMLDVRDAKSSDMTIPNIWSGVMNGLLLSDPVSAQIRIIDNITQCFKQSPYLVVSSN